MRCLNEAVSGSCQKVFKPWDKRLDFTGPTLTSDDDDPELLIHVPFDGSVKLKAICIVGAAEGRSPSKLKVRPCGLEAGGVLEFVLAAAHALRQSGLPDVEAGRQGIY